MAITTANGIPDTTCHFFELPPELRVHVYEYAFRLTPFDPEAPQTPPLLAVCKLVRHEAWLLYEAHVRRIQYHNRIDFEISIRLLRRAQETASSILERLKYLYVDRTMLRVWIEQEYVCGAELLKLALRPQVGGDYTWKKKTQAMMA
ncbi:hypothetical protein CLAFUW4_14007 [Fulvia fulva]|nr:hypothetical protein CLAFUR4_14010 [Fulvia fulva]KAK4611457.1 hypothetical protein CLAFUR0_14014 [Fulvia fulva]WPV22087.1 hypothetical protein CLAFUW4_14007 [Fulvia fulva]